MMEATGRCFSTVLLCVVLLLVQVDIANATQNSSSIFLDGDGNMHVNAEPGRAVFVNGVDVLALASRLTELEQKEMNTSPSGPPYA